MSLLLKTEAGIEKDDRHVLRMPLPDSLFAACGGTGVCSRRISLGLAVVTGLLLVSFARGQAPELGPAPFLMEAARVTIPGRQAEPDVAPINTGSRSSVVAAFHASYLASQGVAIGWNGDAANCTLGVNSTAHKQATLRRVNYFRAMTGLPGVVALDELRSDKSIKAAMMLSAQGQLSHSPGTSWACYSVDGAEATGKSNIALGAEGPGAVDLYMDDHGAGNYFVGHRRWILYPPQIVMGTGSVPNAGGKFAANALWVLANFGSRPAGPEFIAWPAPGFFPFQLLPQLSTRWSFAMPGASFAGTTVVVTRNGLALTTTPEANLNDSGYGDNTFVWKVANVSTVAPPTDTPYVVTLDNVSVGGQTRTFTYTVTVIDPYKPNLETRPAGNELKLAWPTGPTGFLVQAGAINGASVIWANANLTPTTVGSEQQVTISPTNSLQLFRLRKP